MRLKNEITSVELIKGFRQKTKITEDNLVGFEHFFNRVSVKLEKTAFLADRVSKFISKSAGKYKGINQDLALSAAKEAKNIVQDQKDNISFINKKKNELNEIIQSNKSDDYLWMNISELQNHIDNLNELREENIFTIQLRKLQFTQLAIHDFMDKPTKAYIKRLNREIASTYNLLEDKKNELAQMSEKYLSSKVDMLTAHLNDLKIVEEKHKLAPSNILGEQMSGFNEPKEGLSVVPTEIRERASSTQQYLYVDHA